jgi:hypothetical protein
MGFRFYSADHPIAGTVILFSFRSADRRIEYYRKGLCHLFFIVKACSLLSLSCIVEPDLMVLHCSGAFPGNIISTIDTLTSKDIPAFDPHKSYLSATHHNLQRFIPKCDHEVYEGYHHTK